MNEVTFDCGCVAVMSPPDGPLVNVTIRPCSEDCWRPAAAKAEYERIMARRSN